MAGTRLPSILISHTMLHIIYILNCWLSGSGRVDTAGLVVSCSCSGGGPSPCGRPKVGHGSTLAKFINTFLYLNKLSWPLLDLTFQTKDSRLSPVGLGLVRLLPFRLF